MACFDLFANEDLRSVVWKGGRGAWLLFGDGSVGPNGFLLSCFCVFLWTGQEVVMICWGGDGERGGKASHPCSHIG